jgi:hypothetical protein
VLINFLCLPAILSGQSTTDYHDSESFLNKITAKTGHYYFIVAQNDHNGEIKKGADLTTDEEAGQARESKKQSSGIKKDTDPIESFEPTEKVKADQAVDFPYDI